MSMKVVRDLPEEIWRNFVEKHPNGNVYHTPEMFQVFARTRGYQPELWATIDDQGDVLALFLPVWVTLKGGLLRYLTTRGLVYGSVLGLPSVPGQEALNLLLTAYRSYAGRNPILFTELRHIADPGGLRSVLDNNGFRHEEHLNYLIDLARPVDDIWNNITKVGRKAIERSKARGVVVEEIRDPSCIPDLYHLLELTYAHARVPFADVSLFEAVFDILVPKGMVKVLMARGDGPYSAVSLELIHKRMIHRWYNGWDKEYHALYPNDHITWEILKWGAENGYSWYDFGGAGTPGKPYGPREFKAKYGGQLVNYGRATCIHHPVTLSISTLGYQVYRKTI